MPKAEAAARKALELDETLVVAHMALGQILTLFYWKWDEGEKEFQRAAELSGGPDHLSGAANLSLIRRDGFAEAVAADGTRAQTGSAVVRRTAERGHCVPGGGAARSRIAEFRRALEMNRDPSRAHFQLGVTYVAMGRIDDAIRELEATVRSQQEPDSRFEAYLGYVYAAAGPSPRRAQDPEQAQSRRREQYVSSFGIALIHDAFGEKERALAALERAYEDRAVEFALMSQFRRSRRSRANHDSRR